MNQKQTTKKKPVSIIIINSFFSLCLFPFKLVYTLRKITIFKKYFSRCRLSELINDLNLHVKRFQPSGRKYSLEKILLFSYQDRGMLHYKLRSSTQHLT